MAYEKEPKVLVSDLPLSLQSIMANRGVEFTRRMTPRSVAREVAGWNLGDPDWANVILNAYSDAMRAAKPEEA